MKELSAIEKSYYEACRNYQDGGNYSAEDWAAYKSRISAVGLLVDGGYVPPKRRYLTKGMRLSRSLWENRISVILILL